MKLSMAIHEGARLPQCQGAYTQWDEDACAWAYCVLGLACRILGMTESWLIAQMGITTGPDVAEVLQQGYELNFKQEITDPVRMTPSHLDTVLVRLNDDYGWSFSEIANWLERVGL